MHGVPEGFTRVHATMCILVQQLGEQFVGDLSILMGWKKRGHGKGRLTWPGGHFNAEEENDPTEGIIRCAVRESREETGLIGVMPMIVGKIWAKIIDQKIIQEIDIVLFSKLSGTLKTLTEEDEFSELFFIQFSQIPWQEVLPGYRGIMGPIIQQTQPTFGRLFYGRDTNHLVNADYENLDYKKINDKMQKQVKRPEETKTVS